MLNDRKRLPPPGLRPTSQGECAASRRAHQSARIQHLVWQADNDLLDFLRAIEVELPLRRPSELATQAAVKFLARESAGHLDGIMTIVRNAAIHAMLAGEERITMKYLELGKTLPNARLLRAAK